MIFLQHIITIHPLITLTASTTSVQAASLFHFKNNHIPDIFHCNTPLHHKFRRGRDGSKSNHLHYSLLLQSHRQWYGNSPPHDRELYDVLDVRPNATLAEISRSYKTLSREFHPDKVAWRRKRRQRRRKMMEEEGEVPLQEVEGGVATRSETGSGIETNVNMKEIRSNDTVDADFTTNGNPVIEFRQETPSGNDTNNCFKLNPVPTTAQSHFIPPPPPPPLRSNDSESSGNKTVSSSDSHKTSETVEHEHSQTNVLPNATKVCPNSINNPTKIDNVDDNDDDDDEEQRIEEEYCRQKLSEIHHAYEILRDDASRLLYHRFGIRDGPDAAVRLLTGKMMSDFEMGSSGSGTATGDTPEEQCRLLELMGYPPGGYRIPFEYYQHRGHHHHHHHHQHINHDQQHGHDHYHHRHTRCRHHHHDHHHDHHHHHHQPTRQEHRIAYLASTITERLRPIVEGTVSQQLFTEELYRECRNIKRSAMGAQILRCVGRAYRVEGYRVLRKMQWEKKMIHKKDPWERGNIRNRHDSGIGNSIHSPHDVADLFRDGWRDAKHFCSAAVAAGKVMMLERRAKHLEDSYERRKAEKAQQRVSDAKNRLMQRRAGGIEDNYLDTNVQDIIGTLPGEEWSDMENTDHDEDDFFFDVDSIDACFDDEDVSDLFQTGVDCTDGQHDPIDHDLHRIQNKKAHDAILSAHQMEALWKITKIELDRTIRSACRWILSLTDIAVDDYDNLEEDCHRHSTYGADGWFAFCPSEQSPYYEDWQHHPHEFSGSTPFPQPHDRLHQISRENYRHRQKSYRKGEYHTRGPDGWVGTNGEAIPMNVGRLRAAAALVLVGDVMVRCSKESMS